MKKGFIITIALMLVLSSMVGCVVVLDGNTANDAKNTVDNAVNSVTETVTSAFDSLKDQFGGEYSDNTISILVADKMDDEFIKSICDKYKLTLIEYDDESLTYKVQLVEKLNEEELDNLINNIKTEPHVLDVN